MNYADEVVDNDGSREATNMSSPPRLPKLSSMSNNDVAQNMLLSTPVGKVQSHRPILRKRKLPSLAKLAHKQKSVKKTQSLDDDDDE